MILFQNIFFKACSNKGSAASRRHWRWGRWRGRQWLLADPSWSSESFFFLPKVFTLKVLLNVIILKVLFLRFLYESFLMNGKTTMACWCQLIFWKFLLQKFFWKFYIDLLKVLILKVFSKFFLWKFLLWKFSNKSFIMEC